MRVPSGTLLHTYWKWPIYRVDLHNNKYGGFSIAMEPFTRGQMMIEKNAGWRKSIGPATSAALCSQYLGFCVNCSTATSLHGHFNSKCQFMFPVSVMIHCYEFSFGENGIQCSHCGRFPSQSFNLSLKEESARFNSPVSTSTNIILLLKEEILHHFQRPTVETSRSQFNIVWWHNDQNGFVRVTEMMDHLSACHSTLSLGYGGASYALANVWLWKWCRISSIHRSTIYCI